MALLSMQERHAATATFDEVEYVELSDREDFNDRFVEELAFPVPDESTSTVIYWRDIPAQVTAKGEAGSARVQLTDRFQKAIDAAAMKAGLVDMDLYLEEWRQEVPLWRRSRRRGGSGGGAPGGRLRPRPSCCSSLVRADGKHDLLERPCARPRQGRLIRP